MNKKIFIPILILCSTMVKAQDETDILRYSMTQTGTTARGIAIGGALGSIGGDYGSVCVNPAALGRYTKSEFSFSPSFVRNNATGTYNGSEISDSKFKIGANSMSYISANRNKNENSDWKSGAWVFGFNKTANFNTNYTYSGMNNQNSIANKYAEEINSYGGLSGLVNASALANMAYQTYVVDSGIVNKNVATSYVPVSGGISQTKSIMQNGNITEINFGYGGNLQNKLYLGFLVDMPIVSFKRDMQYSETDKSGNDNNDFKSLLLTENLNSSGLGINLKLGAVYTPSKNFRLGLAYHTPTSYSMTDKYSYTFTSNVENLLGPNNSVQTATPFEGMFDYGMTTPGKVIGSTSILFGKIGFITADVDYVAYKNMKYNFKGYSGDKAINGVISIINTNAINYRIGGEIRVNQFNYRLGYGIYGSPFNDSKRDFAQRTASIGFGYRAKKSFYDITYQNIKQNTTEFPYALNSGIVNMANINQRNSALVITMGWLIRNNDY